MRVQIWSSPETCDLLDFHSSLQRFSKNTAGCKRFCAGCVGVYLCGEGTVWMEELARFDTHVSVASGMGSVCLCSLTSVKK